MVPQIRTNPVPDRRTRPVCASLQVADLSRRAAAAGILAAFTAWTGMTTAADMPPGTQSADELIDLPLEQILDVQVYAASKFAQKASDAPSAVTVVTADEIKAYGYRTFADILESIRGLYVSYDRNYSYLGIRGFSQPGDYNTKILVLVDGYRVADNIFDQAPIGTEFPIDVDLISRVEFIPGPGSSIYGSGAFFGVVNVVTRNGTDIAGAEIKGEVASADTKRGRVTLGRAIGNDGSLLLSASGLDSDGDDLYFQEFDSPAAGDGVARGLDYDRVGSFFGKLIDGGLTAGLSHAKREKGIPTASFDQVFNDPRSRTVDERTYLNLGYQTSWSGNDLSARLAYTDWSYAGSYPQDYPPVTLYLDGANGRWWDSEVKLSRTVLESHHLIVGVDYQRDLEQYQFGYDDYPRFVYLDDHREGYHYGIYLQDEITVTPQLLINAGARYGRYSAVDREVVNPRLAAIFKASQMTTLKLLYGTAFRAPNAYELFYTAGYKTNPNLEPETIKTYEMVAEVRRPDGLRLSGSVFKYDTENLITLTMDPADGMFVFRNLERARATGTEMEVEKLWSGGSRLRASMTLQHAENADTGQRLTNSPHLLAKLNYMTGLLHDAVQVGLESQYTGRRLTLAGATGGYAVFNLTLLARRLRPGLEVSASLYNLLDKRYADPGSEEHSQDAIVQDGRTLRLSVSQRF